MVSANRPATQKSRPRHLWADRLKVKTQPLKQTILRVVSPLCVQCVGQLPATHSAKLWLGLLQCVGEEIEGGAMLGGSPHSFALLHLAKQAEQLESFTLGRLLYHTSVPPPHTGPGPKQTIALIG